jgi:hypothetical protein
MGGPLNKGTALTQSEINTLTELSTPQMAGKCERQERV